MRQLLQTSSRIGAFILLPALVILSIYDIIGRQFYNTGSTALQEFQWHLFFGMVMFGLGAAYLNDKHVRIDVVRSHLSPSTRAVIELCGLLFSLLPLSLFMIGFGSAAAWRSFLIDERSQAALGLGSRWIVKSAVPVGGALLLCAGLVVAVKAVAVLRQLKGRAGNRP